MLAERVGEMGEVKVSRGVLVVVVSCRKGLVRTSLVPRPRSGVQVHEMSLTSASYHLKLPDYLAHVDRRLSQENDRLLHYLHKSTR